jgi:hypothetical protein
MGVLAQHYPEPLNSNVVIPAICLLVVTIFSLFNSAKFLNEVILIDLLL